MEFKFKRIFLKKQFPLAISRGVSTGSENLFVLAAENNLTGIGEMAPGVPEDASDNDLAEKALTNLFQSGIEDLSITEIWHLAREQKIPPSALAALDTALWDLLGKKANMPLYALFGLPKKSVATSVTVGINTPENLRLQVPEILNSSQALFLKVKLGSPQGIEADKESYLTILECLKKFSGIGVRVDANGGWSLQDAISMSQWLKEMGCDYIEQPLNSDSDDQLPELFKKRALPIFIDESCNFATDVARLAHCVDGVNLKLMKCGGLTEAVRIVAAARAHGLQTMIGCMSESSVAISAGASIGYLFDHIDLDSHFNLDPDPAAGALMINGVVTPVDRPGHGASFSDAE